MAELVWDQVGDRSYESGLDHAVLYLRDGRVIPWSGLVSIEEAGAESGESLYFDGIKYAQVSGTDDYAATVNAITFPDEMMELEGLLEVAEGMYANEQAPKPFNFSYRTREGNDVEGDEAGYKLHLVYNVIAVVDTRTYNTMSNQAGLTEFGWGFTTMPSDVAGYKPTAHITIESTPMNRFLLRDLEEMLYGTDTTEPTMPSLQTLATYAADYEVITVVDHGDGSFSVTGPEELIEMIDATSWRIKEIEGVFLDSDSYQISTTYP